MAKVVRTKEQNAEHMREYRKRSPDIFRKRELKKSFGITLEKYNEMLEKQNGVCAICGEPETVLLLAKLGDFSVIVAITD